MAQCPESVAAFVEAVGEESEGGDGILSTSWLPCTATRFVDALHAASIASWVRLLPVLTSNLIDYR